MDDKGAQAGIRISEDHLPAIVLGLMADYPQLGRGLDGHLKRRLARRLVQAERRSLVVLAGDETPEARNGVRRFFVRAGVVA